MRINSKLKQTLIEIADKTIEYSNEVDTQRKYLRRILRTYKNTLREEEQMYVLKVISEMIHYRTIATDPDNMITLSNIKLRTYLTIFLLSVVFVVVVFFLIIMLLYIRHNGKLSKQYFKEQQDNLGNMNGYIEEMVAGQKVEKIFNHESQD